MQNYELVRADEKTRVCELRKADRLVMDSEAGLIHNSAGGGVRRAIEATGRPEGGERATHGASLTRSSG